MNIKLTEKQKEIILYLRKDEKRKILWSGGMMVSAMFLRSAGLAPSLRIDTVLKMEKIGLLLTTPHEYRLSDKYYSLTELGKTIKL